MVALQTWMDGFGAWLLDYYFLASLLLLLVAAGMAMVRQPARRLALSWAAVSGLLVLALLASLPGWPRFSLPVVTSPVMQAVDWEPADGRMDIELDPTTAATGAVAGSELTAEAAAGSVLAEPRGAPAAPRRPSRVAPAAVAIWAFLGGTAFVAFWLLTGAVLTANLRRTARRAPEPVQAALMRLLGKQASTEVLLSNRVQQALAVGVFEPRVILPERFLGQESCEALDAVLAHESAHIRNGDLVLLAWIRVLMLVLFAHPLFWWLRSRIRMDQELLADAAAGQQGDVAEYAEILLHWFRTNDTNRSRLFTATLGLWERPHLLKRRIAMLLNERFHVEASASGSWRMATWLVLLAVMSGLSVLTLRESSELAAQQDPLPSVTGPAVGSAALEPQPDAATSDTKYQSVEEAWRIGVAYYNSRNFAASQEPFETALKLAPQDDVDFRLKVYGALKPSYRVLAEFEKMVDACDYILRHAPQEATRSLTRRELLSFVYERGKTDALVQRYENDLKRDPKDRTALYVLAEVYDRIKNDPRRASDLTQRLLALNDQQGLDVGTSARLAMQYVRQKKYREGAELYEQLAPLDAGLAAWHWKEAATAWLKASDSAKALAAARKSAEAGPEKRSQQLLHFWHRHLGETFLAAGEPKLAVEHLEKAVENTTIAGYVNDCQKLLEQARDQAGRAN